MHNNKEEIERRQAPQPGASRLTDSHIRMSSVKMASSSPPTARQRKMTRFPTVLCRQIRSYSQKRLEGIRRVTLT
jgi:hypothetical protein